MQEIVYKCSKCGKRVFIQDGNISRACSHEQAPITADLSAKTVGVGLTMREHDGLQQSTRIDRLD